MWAGINFQMDAAQCEIVPPVYMGGSAALEPGCTAINSMMIGPECAIESEAYLEKSIVFDCTWIGSPAEVRNMIICVDSSGTVINLMRSNTDWVIADARNPTKALIDEQKQILEM